jgi:tape measure domain-containing protein
MSQNREEYIISLIDRGVSSGLKDISASVDSVRARMDGLQNGVGTKSKGLLGSLGGLTSMLGGLGAIAGIGYLGKQVISLGANMEQTKVAFATFMGDTEKANALIGQLNEFANVTPFNNEEVINSGRSLLSAGLSADKVTETLGMLGDIASGVAMPLEDLGQIYSKSMNKGKLQAEELNQLSERGVPLMQELARMTGKNKGELYKMAEQGAITSDVLRQAFKNMTSEGGIYFGLMDKQSETTAGKWSTFVGQLQTLGIKLGEMLLPVLSKFADFGIMLTSNKGLLKDIAIVVGILTGAFIVYKTAMLISTLTTGGFATAMATLNAIMYANPIGVIIGAIALLVAGVTMAIRHFESWGEMLIFVGGPLLWVVSLIKKLYDGWDGIKKAFTEGGIIAGIKKIGATILDVVLSPLQKIFDLLGMETLSKQIKETRKKLGIDVEVKKTTKEETKKTNPLTGVMGDKKGRTKDGAFVFEDLGKGKGKGKTKGTSNLKSGLSEITASAPKTFNIHIGSLVKEQSFTSVQDLSEIKTIVKNEISRLLLGVTNDIQTT